MSTAHSPGSGLWSPDLPLVARQLLSCAVTHFATQGFHATTTRDITRELGLSAGAVYVYFPSKEEVLFQIMMRAQMTILTDVEAAHRLPHAEERLRSVVSTFTAWHARHLLVARVGLHELHALSPVHRDEVMRLRRRTDTLLVSAIRCYLVATSTPSHDVDRLSRAIASLATDVVRWFRTDGPDTPEGLGSDYADLAIRMLGAPWPACGE